MEFHQSGDHGHRHPTNMEELVQMIKQQLDKNLDRNCTPMGGCGSYGYTVVGKGTTPRLWKEVSREADIYHILQRVQGSAVPVFLGRIDFAQDYFLHGAGEIRHMLLMGWGGDNVGCIKHDENIQRAISRSEKKIRSLGVFHQDLRPENILWNPDLKRALIIDFHRCTLDH